MFELSPFMRGESTSFVVIRFGGGGNFISLEGSVTSEIVAAGILAAEGFRTCSGFEGEGCLPGLDNDRFDASGGLGAMSPLGRLYADSISCSDVGMLAVLEKPNSLGSRVLGRAAWLLWLRSKGGGVERMFSETCRGEGRFFGRARSRESFVIGLSETVLARVGAIGESRLDGRGGIGGAWSERESPEFAITPALEKPNIRGSMARIGFGVNGSLSFSLKLCFRA